MLSATLSLVSSSWPCERVQDGVEVALRALVPAEVVGHLVAERDHPRNFLVPGAWLGVEVLDGAAQLEQGCPTLEPSARPPSLSALTGAFEQPVRGLGRLADVGVAHAAHVVRLRGELGDLAAAC